LTTEYNVMFSGYFGLAAEYHKPLEIMKYLVSTRTLPTLLHAPAQSLSHAHPHPISLQALPATAYV
jgi:hypothetical protein